MLNKYDLRKHLEHALMFDMQFKNKRRYDWSWNFVHFWTFSVFVNVELFWQDARMFPEQF